MCRDTAAAVGATTLEGGKAPDTAATAPLHGAPAELASRAEREEVSAQGPLQVGRGGRGGFAGMVGVWDCGACCLWGVLVGQRAAMGCSASTMLRIGELLRPGVVVMLCVLQPQRAQ